MADRGDEFGVDDDGDEAGAGSGQQRLDYYNHKLMLIKEILKKQSKHGYMPLDGSEDSVFELVNKRILKEDLGYSRLKREDRMLMESIRRDKQIQRKGNGQEVRFKNPLFAYDVFIETSDDVVSALEKVSPLDDHKTVRHCTNKVLKPKEPFLPVEEAIYQCKAYGIFATKDDGTGERYVALYRRDQAKRCRDFALSGTVAVKRGEQEVHTSDDLRTEIRHMDAITINGRTYRVSGAVVNVKTNSGAKDVKKVHNITREHGMSSTSNRERLIHGSDTGNRRKYPILSTGFHLDRPYEGPTQNDAIAYKEGAPNDVRTLWTRTLVKAVAALEKQQNAEERMLDRTAPTLQKNKAKKMRSRY